MRLAHGTATPAGHHRFGPSRRKQASRLIIPMEAFLASAGVVAPGKVGEKTRIATIVMVAQFQLLGAML